MNTFEWSENDNFLFEDPFLSENVFNPERNQSIHDLFACQLENPWGIDRYDSFQQAIDDWEFQKPIKLNSNLSDHVALDRSIDTKPTKESSKDANQTKTQTYPQIFKVFKIQKHFIGQKLSTNITFWKNSTYDNFYKSNENYDESEVSNYIINGNATSNATHKMTRFGRSHDKGKDFNSIILIGASRLF